MKTGLSSKSFEPTLQRGGTPKLKLTFLTLTFCSNNITGSQKGKREGRLRQLFAL